MIKPHPGPNLPVVHLRRQESPNIKSYNVAIPGDPTHKRFEDLLDAIDYLRSRNTSRCYIVDGNECYTIGWSQLISPWEGPGI